jgi:hypothetical protein
MSASRKVLLACGLALVIWAMADGLWYALFAEHQDLEHMGASVTTAFVSAAERKMPEAQAALDSYSETRFRYVRNVDVHSHWGGLALLLIVFGAIFDRVGFSERMRLYLAGMLVAGAVLFPLGVILEVPDRGILPKGIAVLGTALIIAALAAVALGFARGEKVNQG